MPGPGSSVEALAAMIWISAQGDAGTGIALIKSIEDVRTNVLKTYRLVTSELHPPSIL